jgi:hypothetical protein
MRRILLLFIFCCLVIRATLGQDKGDLVSGISLAGIVLDASTSSPVTDTQIHINNTFSSINNSDGTFSIIIHKDDTLTFTHLGYKPARWLVSDTLKGNDFIAGIYLHADTVSIAEVIIVPRYNNLRSQILNSPSKIPSTMDNARYNVAISAYQGRTTTGKLGDAASNYDLIHKRQSIAAYEKGGIPSDAIAGFSPLILIPAVYMLLHGMPEKPPSFDRKLNQQEIEQIRKAYTDMLNQQK